MPEPTGAIMIGGSFVPVYADGEAPITINDDLELVVSNLYDIAAEHECNEDDL